MYGVTVYITAEDVLENLSEEDRAKVNKCIFYDVSKSLDGSSIDIHCLLFNDQNEYTKSQYRYRYCDDGKIKLH